MIRYDDLDERTKALLETDIDFAYSHLFPSVDEATNRLNELAEAGYPAGRVVEVLIGKRPGVEVRTQYDGFMYVTQERWDWL